MVHTKENGFKNENPFY